MAEQIKSILVNLWHIPLQREALHTWAFRIPQIAWIGNCLRSTLALLFRSEIFWVFSLHDQIFRDVVWVLLHPNHCALLGLLEQVDTLLDPHTELLLCLLTLVQVPLGQHLVHLTERAKDGTT